MRRVQSWKILAAVIVPPILLMIDYGHGETVTSPFQRRFQRWWYRFCALDSCDVAVRRKGVLGWVEVRPIYRPRDAVRARVEASPAPLALFCVSLTLCGVFVDVRFIVS